MKFGIAYLTHPRYVDSAVEADALGYDSIHLYDSPLVFSEVFSVAGAIASRVSRAKVALSVAVPSLRLPHVLASGMGTLNQFAPGRVQLGLGTGYTAAQTTDTKADTWATVADTVRICRGILSNEVTDVTIKAQVRGVRHLHADLDYINVNDPVPICISAAGPKGMGIAADMADGFYAMSAGQRPTYASMSAFLGELNAMTDQRGRDPLPVTLFTTMAVKDPGEPSDSERLRGFVGPAVTQHFHGNLGFGPEEPRTPPPLREAAVRYYEEVGKHISGPTPWLKIHRYHAMLVRDDEAHLLNPELIEAVCQVGTADDLLEEIAEMERAGVDEIVWQVMPDHEDEVARFAKDVMAPYRAAARG